MINKNPYPFSNVVQIKLSELVKKLFKETKPIQRCKYLKKDVHGIYCSSDTKKGSRIDFAQREACDPISLKLYCLDREECKTCTRYNGNVFRYLYD